MRKKLTLIACMASLLGFCATASGTRGDTSPDAGAGIAEKGSPQKAVPTTLPYYNDFNDESKFEGWTVVNTNPHFTWQWYQWSGYEYTPCLYMCQSPDEGFGTASDNWAFSPAFELQAGFTYRLKFYVSNWFPSDLEVRLVTKAGISDPGTLLYHYEGSAWGDKEAEFEVPSDGTYYLAFYDKSPWTCNDTALRYQVYIDNLSLEAMSNNAVPEAAGDVRQVPGANGEISMGLTWINPTLSKKGETLDLLSNVRIFRDGTLVETIRDNVVPGARMSWTDPSPTAGVHVYKVIVSNTTGESDPAEVNTFVGIDDPGTPENLNVDYDADGGIITLDWEEPQFGRRGGWYDKTGLSYRVVRQPGGRLLANNLADPYYEDEDLSEYGNYIYEVTARTNSGLGGTVVSNGTLVGSVASLPIREGWENPDTYPLWEIVDNNDDGHTIFVKKSFGHESNSSIGWNYVQTEVDIDESLYSAPVRLEKGKKYRASFWIMSNMMGSFTCDLTYGKSKTKAAQTGKIISYAGMTTGGVYAPAEAEFSVDETGTYYFSLWVHDCSRHALWFDDFRFEEIFDKNVEATAVRNLDNTPTAGDRITTGVKYTNRGTDRSSSFKVQLIDDDGTVLGEQTVSRPLAAGTDGTANISWTVPEVTGRFAIRGRVVMDGDKCAADNVSEPLYLDIQEKGKRAITIGTSSDLSAKLPFDNYSYNFSETIYHGEDFGNIAGNITSMNFKVQFGMDADYPKVPFSVYICNTTENDLFKGWIPSTRMTKVFDGTLDFMRGMTEVEIPFDTPFNYTGGNICVLVAGGHEANLMISNGYGMFNYVTEVGLGASRVWNSNYFKPDPANPDQTVGAFHTVRPNATFFIDHSVTARITGTVTDTDGNPVEGAVVNGGRTYPYLSAETDSEGKYEIPYFPVGWGSASLEANKRGWQTGRINGSVKAGETAVLDCNTMQKCAEIKVKGKVASATDNTTPVSGATVTVKGDNEFSVKTDTEGNFVIDGAYANKAYQVFTIEADGFKSLSWPGTQFFDYSGSGEYQMTGLNLTPVTASPFSVTALDRGEKAEISWEAPVDDVTVSKCTDDIVGQFGGIGTISVAHRYSPEELKNLGVEDNLLLKAIRFMPMCYSKYTLAIWQGPEGNEAPVYMEDVDVTDFKQWNEFVLSKPYSIDPTKSLLVGLKIQASSGAYPVSFDYGPLADGGDVIFDVTNNVWTTAHDVLPGQMNYNWAIQAVFGNNPNSAPVSWLKESSDAPERKAISIEDANLEEMLALNGNTQAPEAETVESMGGCSLMMLDTPVRTVPDGKPLKNEFKGYNIYRIEPGQENSYMGLWTKVNEEPVTVTTFTDDTWGDIENKPYRYAVVSFYGNPYEWGTGVTSAPTFSDGIDKGHYASVTVNVDADNGTAEGTRVYLVGDGKSLTKTVGVGNNSVTFDDVRFTDYTVRAIKPYFDLYSADMNVDKSTVSHDAVIRFSAPAPSDMQAVDYIKETRLAWTAPSPVVGREFMECSATPLSPLPFNLGKETIVGHRVTPDMRAGYDYTDFWFDEISFYANAATTYCPVIWRRNLEPDRPMWEQTVMEEEHEIYRQEYKVTPDEVGTWITVRLDEPVKISSGDTYYYGVAAVTTNEAIPFVLDDSGNKYEEGMWYYDYSMKDARYMWIRPSMNGAWMVKAHITDTPDNSTVVAESVKYDLYRLAESDVDKESSWTKVNASLLEEESHVDSAWKDQPDADYRYAVKAIFSGDAVSKAAFSKMLPKGKVALLTANVTTNNGLSAAGSVLSLKSGNLTFRGEADSNGKLEIPEVTKGRKYNLSLSLPAYEEISEDVNVDKSEMALGYELVEIKEAPVYVDAAAAADNSKVDLTWREPGSYAPAEGWVYWDNGKPYGGFGTSTGFCAVAHAYMPEDLESKRMKEYDITKISFFPTSSKSNPVSETSYWVAKIWRINMTSGEVTEVATGNGDNVILDQWNEIAFDTPYHINGDESILVGYEFHGAGNALGIDQGPCAMGRGDWANFGQGWMTLSSSVDGFNYNNLIHVYVENLEKSARGEAPAAGPSQPILKDAKAEVSVSKVRAADRTEAEHPRLVSGVKYHVKGYNVYRLASGDRDNESAWTLLTPNPVSVTEFADIDWKNVAKGSYIWAVKAVYASGVSTPAFSMDSLNDDGSVNAVDEVGDDGISVMALSENKILVKVPADATVVISDTRGMNILSANAKAGENILEVDTADGICLIRVNVNGNIRSFKLMMR